MQIFLCFAVFVITFLYASVGHGGASGFLAVMSFVLFPPLEVSTTALMVNMLVSGLSFLSYKSAGHFRPWLLLPFLIASVPASFLGGSLDVSAQFYRYFLAVVLFYAAIYLNFPYSPFVKGVARSDGVLREDAGEGEIVKEQKHFFWISLLVGTVIGLISGIIGIGGGIFLTPYLLMTRLSTTKESAAVSAPFIFINSAAGLLGRALTSRLAIGTFFPYLIASFFGGISGSYLGSRHISVPLLRKILALVLIFASLKLFVT